MLKSKVFFLMLFSFLLFSSVAMAQTGDTISGHVLYEDGTPVEGVEVFLGLSGDSFEARYTCTDASGYYEFTGVPDVPLLSAVGPDIDDRDICSRPYFTDSLYNPIVIQYFDGGSEPSEITTFTVADSPVDYTVQLWETENNFWLDYFIVSAHRILHEDWTSGDFTRFYARVSLIIRLAEAYAARGDISVDTANGIIDAATHYLAIGG